MNRKKQNIIIKVLPNSIAQELSIEPGDILLHINQKDIQDVFDYRYQISDDYIEVGILKPNGEEWLLEIEKGMNEDLGIIFENDLMDHVRSCRNKCIFCFIDQLPPNMRSSLYFKDDDSRLSFLQGNYVTLTNMSDEDFERIIYYHLSPINISVHTTNPELRKAMLNNRFAGNITERIEKLTKARIQMNGQIVLCKGVNDGKELEKTIKDLTQFIPYMQSVSVVPVGLSKYREGLFPLEAFDAQDADEILTSIHHWQEKIFRKYGMHFIHAADEFYFLAQKPFTSVDSYDGFLQLENGVGMVTLMKEEFLKMYHSLNGDEQLSKELSIATGLLAYPFIQSLLEKLKRKYPKINVHLYGIINHFFGEQITVSGLLTGQDIITQLREKKLGKKLLLPKNLLKADEPKLLDDTTIDDLENALQVPIVIVESTGYDFIHAILDIKENTNE